MGVGLGVATLSVSDLVAARPPQVNNKGSRHAESDSHAQLLQLVIGRLAAASAVDNTTFPPGAGAVSGLLVVEGDLLPAPFATALGTRAPSREAARTGLALHAWPRCFSAEPSALHSATAASPLAPPATSLVEMAEVPERHANVGLNHDETERWAVEPCKLEQAASSHAHVLHQPADRPRSSRAASHRSPPSRAT